MNIQPECPWVDVITDEFAQAGELFGFDGVHMNTYGQPKAGFSPLTNRIVQLDEHPFLDMAESFHIYYSPFGRLIKPAAQ